MEALTTINRHYEHISQTLDSLKLIIFDIENKGLSADRLQELETFINFINRDMKNQLRIEEDTLTSMRRELGEHDSKDILQAIREHDVLYGALDQFVYGIKMESKPDITESAKSILDHFPSHIKRIHTIAQANNQVLH